MFEPDGTISSSSLSSLHVRRRTPPRARAMPIAPRWRQVTPFQRKVYDAISTIPRGKVTTYKDLARAVGCGSTQAVGQALKRNPLGPVRARSARRCVADVFPGLVPTDRAVPSCDRLRPRPGWLQRTIGPLQFHAAHEARHATCGRRADECWRTSCACCRARLLQCHHFCAPRCKAIHVIHRLLYAMQHACTVRNVQSACNFLAVISLVAQSITQSLCKSQGSHRQAAPQLPCAPAAGVLRPGAWRSSAPRVHHSSHRHSRRDALGSCWGLGRRTTAVCPAHSRGLAHGSPLPQTPRTWLLLLDLRCPAYACHCALGACVGSTGCVRRRLRSSRRTH